MIWHVGSSWQNSPQNLMPVQALVTRAAGCLDLKGMMTVYLLDDVSRGDNLLQWLLLLVLLLPCKPVVAVSRLFVFVDRFYAILGCICPPTPKQNRKTSTKK